MNFARLRTFVYVKIMYQNFSHTYDGSFRIQNDHKIKSERVLNRLYHVPVTKSIPENPSFIIEELKPPSNTSNILSISSDIFQRLYTLCLQKNHVAKFFT